MDIRRLVVTVGPTVGATGVAFAEAITPFVAGRIEAVNVDFNQIPVAGTDFYLSPENEDFGSGPTVMPSIVHITSFSGDRLFVMPRYNTHLPGGTVITYEGTYPVMERFPVYGRLVALLDETDAGLIAVVTVWIEGKIGC